MVSEKDARWIVGTYDLPHKLEQGVTRFAIERLNYSKKNFYSVTFDDLYRDIAWLIDDVFKVPYEARRVSSLDSRIVWGTLYDSIGKEDEQEEEKEKPKLSISKVVNALRNRLDLPYLDAINELLSIKSGTHEYADLLWSITPDKIDTRLLEERLQELRDRYERDGRLVIPPRPISAIRFKPLSIEFGRRRYNGNPIALFRENFEAYKDRSRSRLSSFDSGIYRALRIYGQLELAIPEKIITNSLPQEKIAEIPYTVEANEGNTTASAKILNLSRKTTSKHAKAAGVKVRKVGDPLFSSKEISDNIIPAHAKFDGYAWEASKHKYGLDNKKYSASTFLRYWRSYGLPIQKRSRQPLYQKKRDLFVAAFSAFDGNATEAAEYLPYDRHTFSRSWRALGLKT